MLSADTCEGYGDRGASYVPTIMFTMRPTTPPPALRQPPSGPRSDVAVINALGKDDDNNDHN